jgi:hypothetical protein
MTSFRTITDISIGPRSEMSLKDSRPQRSVNNLCFHFSLLPITLGHGPNILADLNGKIGDSKLDKYTLIFSRSLEWAPQNCCHQVMH